jgi:hypothetical protein
MRTFTLILTLTCLTILSVYGQSEPRLSDMSNYLLDEPDSVLFEKTPYWGKDAFHLKKLRSHDMDKGSDAAYLKEFEFQNGTIECDMASGIFTGIAFRAKNGGQFECIYFRPFNAGTEKHDYTVQYVAKGSKYSWHYLRKNFPGKYESGAEIKKNEWFHARLEIRDTSVKVYINNDPEPVLIVEDMKYGISRGSVGFWSWDGYFANLKITKEL